MSNTDELMAMADQMADTYCAARSPRSDAFDDVVYRRAREALEVAIASLQARLDAAEKDAARWRWFAGDCDGNGQDDLIHYLTRFVVSKAEIDAAVDAQMGSE